MIIRVTMILYCEMCCDILGSALWQVYIEKKTRPQNTHLANKKQTKKKQTKKTNKKNKYIYIYILYMLKYVSKLIHINIFSNINIFFYQYIFGTFL